MDKPIVFVDIETTGTSFVKDGIIEIGLVRAEPTGEVVEYTTLIKPSSGYIPPFIATITGIKPHMLETAPYFHEVVPAILPLLEGAVFAAHNARFDFAFLKHALENMGIAFNPPVLCTVKLSRFLYPHYPRHSLDAIIERFHISVKERHRALPDAQAIYHFYNRAKEEFHGDMFLSTINDVLKTPSIPSQLEKNEVYSLPTGAGVYLLYGSEGELLYVGKSNNIKERVLSHLSNALGNAADMRLARTLYAIEAIPTAGELGALLLESAIIKELKPLYNRRLRKSEEWLAVVALQKDGYTGAVIKPLASVSREQVLAMVRGKRQAKELLTTLAHKHGLCSHFLGLEKGSKTGTPCFNKKLGICSGACIGTINPAVYHAKVISAFAPYMVKTWPYQGPITVVEYNPLTEAKDVITLNNWKVERVSFSSHSAKAYEHLVLMDTSPDTMAIIRRFLQSKNMRSRVQILTGERVYFEGDSGV